MRIFARMLGRVPAGHLWYLLRRMRNEKPHRFAGQIRINTFFPPYPSIAFDRFLKAVTERRRVPYSTYLAVTSACPYRCPHCSYGRRRDVTLRREQALNIIFQVKTLGTATLGFTGGEPLLRGDLEELVSAAGPEMATIVFTTGWALDGPRARRLAEAGVTCLTVGIESSDAGEHDSVRGAAGSFAKARDAVRVTREAGIYTAVSTIGTREKIASGELERMYRLAAEWGVGEFRLLAPVATGGAAGRGAFMLSEDERRALYDFHVAHNRRRGGPAVACFAYLESQEMFGCGAGYHHLFIDAGGEVSPCDLTPLSFGSAIDEPLSEIWRRMASYFPLPRCECLMGELAGKLGGTAALPLGRRESELICPARSPDEPLPEGYRRLAAASESPAR